MSESTFTLLVRAPGSFSDVVEKARAELAAEGFGILTEIDLSATLKAKLGVEVPPQLILGACRPPLAHAAVSALPAIATLLPCNVVVRETASGVEVEAFDPEAMGRLAGGEHASQMQPVIAEARERLQRALAAIGGEVHPAL